MTNSRDTQELLPEAGHEMLRIFFTHPARTSLLQDFAFYEVCIEFDGPFFFVMKLIPLQLQSIQKLSPQQPSPSASPQPQAAQSSPQAFVMPNPNAAPYGVSQHMGASLPMMQGQQYMQSVMRHPSPVPSGGYSMPHSTGNF